MTRPITHFLLSVALSGCYDSGSRDRSSGDGSTDPATDDPRTDDVVAEDAPTDPAIDLVPDGWGFEDRDIPDRNIPVNLLFAALPDIAYSGSSVGLVYRGMESGAGEAVGFIPLGSRGEAIGAETLLAYGSGLESAMPRIASTGDGAFLVTILEGAPANRIIMQRVSAAGEILAESSASLPTTITSPISPPLRIGDYAFVAASGYMPGGEGIVIFRSTYPNLEFEHIGMIIPSDCSGGDPLIAKDPVLDQILLFHKCPLSENVLVKWMDTDLNPTGATTMFGHTPVTAFHASSSLSGWFGYGFEERLSVTSLQFWEFNPSDDLWLAPDIEAHLNGSFMDSDHSDHAGFRTTGATFTVLYNDVWEVWARLSAHPPYPGGLNGHLMTVSDRVEADDSADIPISSVAWTDGGFLVVWDQWREDTTYSLFSSFIKLDYDY